MRISFNVRQLVLGSCMLTVAGGGCASEPKQPSQPAAATVKMNLHSFDPDSVTIHAGEAVFWKNPSIAWHTVTADPAKAKKPEDVLLPAGAETFDSGKVNSGQSYWRVFTVPGTYRYFCQPHETKGMVGEIVVKPAAAQ
jgi:plastocyanin